MEKIFIAFIILAAVAGHTPLQAQYYGLRSFEGKKVSVHIEALPHEARNKTTLRPSSGNKHYIRINHRNNCL